MKFSLFTCMIPDLAPAQALERMAAAGYDAVCWRVAGKDPARASEAPSYWGNNLCTLDLARLEEEAAALKAASPKGLPAASLVSYLDLAHFDPAELRRIFAAAKLLGAGQVRVNAPRYDPERPFRAQLEGARAGLAAAVDLAAGYGVKVVVELHMNLISASPSLTALLVAGFDPQRVGVIYDPANMVVEGMEDHRLGLDLLGAHLACVHVKNIGWYPKAGGGWEWKVVPVPEGIVDWKDMMGLLKKRGYDGLVSFEDFGPWSTREKLEKNLPYLKSLI